uniref:Large ribosomal subunit protein bL32c n=1 Tax=Calliarthron tuberculosum TaxID=48942 RepID=M4IUV5_CALTB|nr:50S ribosomal protein L32 [Calliarthron tuberculosum]AGA63754.1 50S ribosomal protein L32 [Calliarthron tuberculosum]
MAVPKKRTSKAKTRSRKAKWKRKAFYVSKQAISLAKSVFTTKSNSYIYLSKDVNTDISLNS